MTSMKELDLSGNDLSGDKRLFDKLSSLTNLEILKLSSCELQEMPDRYVTDNGLLLYYVLLNNRLITIFLLNISEQE